MLRAALLLHALLALPAALNFLARPSEQLATPAPQAHAVIRQYALLLLSSCVVALVLAFPAGQGSTTRRSTSGEWRARASQGGEEIPATTDEGRDRQPFAQVSGDHEDEPPATDLTARRVAGALALYHVGPMFRAAGRIYAASMLSGEGQSRGGEVYGTAFGGPVVHLVAHGIVLAALLMAWLGKGSLPRRVDDVSRKRQE